MQQIIATVESSSASERPFGLGGKSLPARLWSTLTGLALDAASVLSGVLGRFDSGISSSIDIDRVSARLGVARRARSDGENEYPPSSEESVSGAQREIIAHFRQLQRRAQRRTRILAGKPRKIRRKIDLAGMDGTLRDIPSRCENDLLRMLAEWKSRLASVRNGATERSQENETEGEAAKWRIPTAIQFAFLAAVTSGCAFLLSNTSAFGLGSESTLARVWIFVTLLVVAILSSAVARAASSSISHDGSSRTADKWLFGAASLAFIGLTSLLASHYLSGIAANPDTSLSAVFVSLFVERTVPLLPLENWTVFAIVSAAALLTFFVCYTDDSSYSSRQSPRGERALLLKQLRLVNTKIDEAQAEVTATLKRAKATLGKYARRVEESRHLSEKLTDFDYVLEDACNMVLERYREDNSKVRTTEVPHSFEEHVCFRVEEEASLASHSDEQRDLDQLQQELGELESLATEIRQKLRDLNSRAIQALEESITP